jgi:hypothetical protein
MARLQRTGVRNQRLGDRVRGWTAHANDTDPAAAGWGCFGDDGIGGCKHGSEKTAAVSPVKPQVTYGRRS